jgi:hypothetical protein
MILDEVLKNRALRKALAAGEEQVSKVLGRLLSSGAVTTGLSGLAKTASQARETFDRGVQQALKAAHLPSREDVSQLKRKLAELEAMIDGLSGRVEAEGRGAPRAEAPDPEEPAD